VLRSDGLNLLDPLRSDKAPSLRERFEALLQSKSHAFEQASMHNVGERMPIQNSMKIRREAQSTSNLSQTPEENFGARHLRAWRQVFRIARIANDCVGRDAAQQKRGRR